MQQSEADEQAGSDNAGKRSGIEETLELVRTPEADRKVRKQQEAEERRRSRRVESLENQIHELETVIADMQEEISDPERASDFEWMHEQAEKLADYEQKVSDLYDEWLELQ
jgi:ATP-binding cassette subfamily F protein 3